MVTPDHDRQQSKEWCKWLFMLYIVQLVRHVFSTSCKEMAIFVDDQHKFHILVIYLFIYDGGVQLYSKL